MAASHAYIPLTFVTANIYGKLRCLFNCLKLHDKCLLEFLARKVDAVKNIPTSPLKKKPNEG